MIAAIGENRELGKNNKLLWDIPEDMKRFRDLTRGHVVIMGRKTHESIGKLLPNRMNIIVTRDLSYTTRVRPHSSRDVQICHSLEKGLKIAKDELIQKKFPGAIFIIGGGQIYEQGIKYADKLYLTIVKGKFAADTFFPDYPEFKKVVLKRESKNGKDRYTFLDLKKN